ncbi:hypothetical protein [Amycolatopsis minnesotensis]|uniref:hypothetical protein n=1 Tax=Amycolatopsis minnesotensis TaxID=337894 RepID=UPI0031E240CF
MRRFTDRMIRRTSVSMLDPWALLPPPAAVSGLNVLGGRFVVSRLLVLGAFARGRSTLLTAVGVLIPLMAVWLGAALTLGLPWSWRLAVALVLAVAAVVRTVTRPMLDFGNLGLVSIEGVLIPAGLIVQLVRGPDLLLVGTLLLT